MRRIDLCMAQFGNAAMWRCVALCGARVRARRNGRPESSRTAALALIRAPVVAVQESQVDDRYPRVWRPRITRRLRTGVSARS